MMSGQGSSPGTNRPFFSILVPVYNVEEYLPECLSSIDAQTFRDFETILVDDGSLDSCPEICDAWVSKRPFARVIHKQNEGLYMARYSAYTSACGRYFVFLDSDDMAHPNLLECLHKAIADATATKDGKAPDIVFYNYSHKADYSVKDNLLDLPDGLYEGTRTEEIRRACALKKTNNIFTKCCRAELFAGEVANEDLIGITYYEDWLLSATLIGKVHRACVISDILYYYRTNPQSAMHTHKAGTVAQYAFVFRKLADIAASWGGPYPDYFRRGMADGAFDHVRRITTFAQTPEVFASESAALTDLICSLGLQNTVANSFIEQYHDFMIRLFVAGHYTFVKLVARTHKALKKHEKSFAKAKQLLSGRRY